MNNLIRLRDGVAEVCRDDPWQLLRELPDALPPGPLLLPLAAWLERRGEAGAAALGWRRTMRWRPCCRTSPSCR